MSDITNYLQAMCDGSDFINDIGKSDHRLLILGSASPKLFGDNLTIIRGGKSISFNLSDPESIDHMFTVAEDIRSQLTPSLEAYLGDY